MLYEIQRTAVIDVVTPPCNTEIRWCSFLNLTRAQKGQNDKNILDILFLYDTTCYKIKIFGEIYNMTLRDLMPSGICQKGPPKTVLEVTLVFQPKRFTESLNYEWPLNHFHIGIGGATKQYTSFEQTHKIHYKI